MGRSSKHAYRAVGAHFCLVAALLLYAPLAGVAWGAASMNCCEGDYCPIHHHRHSQSSNHMNCNHGADEMAGCAMDCCHTPERAALTASIFVLPRVEIATRSDVATAVAEAQQSDEIRVFRDPASPPPRPAASIL